MNTLKKLWKSVQTFGYPLRATDSYRPSDLLKRRNNNDYKTAALEIMEPRVLLTSLTVATDNVVASDHYVDVYGVAYTVSINGHAGDRVELIFRNASGQLGNYVAPSGGSTAGMDLYSIIVTTTSDTTCLSVYGIAPGSDGKLAGNLYGDGSGLWTGADYDVTAPKGGGTVYIGGRDGASADKINHMPVVSTATSAVGTIDGSSQTALDRVKTLTGSTGYNAGIYVLPKASDGSVQSIKNILIDGTVTGNVYISGSVDTFYCGWLMTGNLTPGGASVQHDSFYVAGDIGNFIVRTSVGTDATTSINFSDPNTYYTNRVEIHVGGQIGSLKVGGAFFGSVKADNNANAPGLGNGWVQNENSFSTWLVGTANTTLDNKAYWFSHGLLPILDPSDPTSNAGSSPTYIGSVAADSATTGISATVSGDISYSDLDKNKTDTYAVGLLAGQKITITLSLTSGSVRWGIMDAENRIVAMTENWFALGGANATRTLTFTAKEAGLYRLIIGTADDTSLNGGGTKGSGDYTFTVKGLGTMAIGAISAGGAMAIDDEADAAGIVATRGNIGAIVAGTSMYSFDDSGSLSIDPKGGTASYSGTPSITVSNGNIGAVVGSSIGTAAPVNGILNGVSMNVLGTIGMISATNGLLGAYAIASGNIQLIDGSNGDVAGRYASKKSIGVIRAHEMLMGSTETQFSADYDNTGRDGIIDLIDVTGNLGSLNWGGPRITTGTGGNVRFIHISDSSSVFQDDYFTGGASDVRGGVNYYTGDTIAPIVDDSGSEIILTPVGKTADTNGLVLTVWTYGIVGTGGSVLIRVESNVSLNISANSGSSNTTQSAEIGDIVMKGVGAALVPSTNAVLVNPAITSNNLSVSGNFRVDVFEVSNFGGNVINTISNSSGGDIVNVNAGDIGSIAVSGSLGLTTNNTGNELNQILVIANTFPFFEQHNGILAGNIGSIAAGKAIGAIISTGSAGVGTIVANYGDVNDPNIFEGLVGPIQIQGNVNSIDIGEGLGSYGYGSYPTSGIYVQGIIYSITGTDADIRGDIISNNSINSIHLTNGSIVGSLVAVYSELLMGWRYLPSTVTPEYIEHKSDTVNNPVYEIGQVTIDGEGGILGSNFGAADIGFIEVKNTGFGVLQTTFDTLANGVLGGIKAGGLGIMGDSFSGYRIGYLIATGDGSAFDLGDRFQSLRQSEHVVTDPLTGQAILDENPNVTTGKTNLLFDYKYTDLSLYLSHYKTLYGGITFNTGMIYFGSYQGAYGIGTVTAYGLYGTSFSFANSINSITVTKDVYLTDILTGTISSLKVGGNFNSSSLEAAGRITSVVINGNVDASSLIYGKGASSSIGTVLVKGNFAGSLVSTGNISTLNLGDATTGIGTLSGNIRLLGDKAAGNINFYGTVAGGASIEINGDVSGTLRFTKGFDGTLTIEGNVAGIAITPNGNNATGMTGDISVNGNLTSMTVTGAMSSTATLTVQGDLGTFVITDNDTNTNDALLAGKILVGGVITGVTINGDSIKGGSLTGTVQAAKSIGTITVNNGDVANGAVIKSLMAGITKVSVTNGIIDGKVDADGAIGTIELKLPSSKVTARTNGFIGANARISGASLTTLTVPGDIAAAAAITLTGALGTTAIKGNIADGATISASSIGKTFTVTGNMDGDLTLSQVGVVSTININGTFGDSGSTATLTTAGSLKLTVNGIFDSASVLRVGGNLVSLIAKNAADGTIIVNGTITSLSAASMTGAVVTAGVNIDKLTVTGALNNSLVQAGITAGNDGTFGTADANEKTTMGAIGAVSVGSLTNSVIAAGGAINSLTSKGVMTNSSASSGLVYNGTKIQTVIGDATPLASDAEIQALRIGGTLYHGNFNTVSINGGKADGLINSALTAGISAGANGIFEASDTTDAPGMSTFKSVKALMPTSGNTSVILAETTTAAKAVNGGTVTGSATHTLPTISSPLITESSPHVANKYVFTVDGQTVTITVSAGVTVEAYDDGSGDGILDTLLIKSTSAAAGSVKVVATNPNALSIGQVLAGDDVNLGTFTFNGDIVGVTGQPAVQIDSNMTTFSVRNLLNSDTTSVIGGDVTNLTIGEMRDGTLTVAGAVKSLNVTTNTNGGSFVANSFGTITLGAKTSTSDYKGTFTALLGGTVNSIGSVVINGTGKFSGVITAAGSIGTIAAAKGSFEKAIISASDDVKSITLTMGKVDVDSTITVGGTLGTLSIKGDLDGTVHANTVGTLTVSGNLTYVDSSNYATIQVDNAATKITIGGNANGTLTAGTIGTLAITGNVSATSHVSIAGDVGSLTVTGGTATGSYIFVDGTITGLKVSGTHAGTIATGIGGNVGTATFATVTSGALVVAGDLVKLIVTGDATSSLFSAGVYIGANGLYNDADDVVYGGKIGSASFSGIYKDSILAAGVLPRFTGSTGIPADARDYIGTFVTTATGVIYTDDPSTTGGITVSTIGKVTFTKKVQSSYADTGHMAVVVAADGIAPLTNTGLLYSRVIGNPSEPLTVKSTKLVDTNKIEVVFTQPIDSSTINDQTVIVNDKDGNAYDPAELSFSYATRTADDSTTEYVVTITRSVNTFNTSTVASDADTLTLKGGIGGAHGTAISNHVGDRSAKVTELAYVPFSTVTGLPVTVPA